MNTTGATAVAFVTLAAVLFIGHCSPTGLSLGFTHANRTAKQEKRARECEKRGESSASPDVKAATETAAR